MLRQSLQLAAGVCVAILIVACSSGSTDADSTDTAAAAPAAEARQPTVFDDQLKALDKARAVEQELQKAKAERDKQIDEQSGG